MLFQPAIVYISTWQFQAKRRIQISLALISSSDPKESNLALTVTNRAQLFTLPKDFAVVEVERLLKDTH